VSNAEINRELQCSNGSSAWSSRTVSSPSGRTAMLREDYVRQGFFEHHHYASVLKHLPEELRPIVTFAYSGGSAVVSLSRRYSGAAAAYSRGGDA
jgi:hypothetical protein